MDKDKLKAVANIIEMSAKFIHLSRVVSLKHPSTIERITKYVDDNLHNTISISDISRHLSLSKSYLSRLIKESFRMPLSQYVLRVKIEKAQMLFRDTNKDSKEIAVASGFDDPNYFSRVFKKIVGISPSQYRKR